MLDDYDVDIAKGQALHKPTGHVFMFHGTMSPDHVTISGVRPNPAGDPTPEELRAEALLAVQRAMRCAAGGSPP